MNDPHVKALYYQVISGDCVDYDKAEPISVDTENFTLNMNATSATFEMKTHYGTKKEAMAIVDMFIRRWEVCIGLEQDPGDLKLVFQNADIIDRSPKKSGSTTLSAHCNFHMEISDNVALHVSRGRFPSPPKQFSLSPDVETMYTRYKAYREGRESLLSMAYMCLTVIEAHAGGRADAAKKYFVAKSVLNKLGTLCSERGGATEARKKPKNGVFIPISSQEKEWVIQVVKALIRRVGEHVYDPAATLPQLTNDDFPKI